MGTEGHTQFGELHAADGTNTNNSSPSEKKKKYQNHITAKQKKWASCFAGLLMLHRNTRYEAAQVHSNHHYVYSAEEEAQSYSHIDVCSYRHVHIDSMILSCSQTWLPHTALVTDILCSFSGMFGFHRNTYHFKHSIYRHHRREIRLQWLESTKCHSVNKGQHFHSSCLFQHMSFP